jgi:ABC-type cobalamin/Fe3+-siderophores transport system ATPase subunit
MLELQGLTRRYRDLVALDDLSFTVREGQMFGFVGPNGAGKTTAMRIVLGVLEPDRARCDGVAVRSTPRPGGASATCPRTTDKRSLDSSLDSRHSSTLCQFGQQTQHPPTYPRCRCGKTERHAREEQPAVQVRRRQAVVLPD